LFVGEGFEQQGDFCRVQFTEDLANLMQIALLQRLLQAIKTAECRILTILYGILFGIIAHARPLPIWRKV
jgi:hypothetical protein